MNNEFETLMTISKYETLQEFRKWQNELPALHFKNEWNVKIIPAFGGAIIRFFIDYNGKHVSVYFDGYSRLGWMYDEQENPIPYFEYYDGNDCYRYKIDESDKMMEAIERFLES